MAGYDGITAGYLIRGDRPCLVETGTAPSAPVVRDALSQLGVGAGDLVTVVVTHIHLDHAGGAGDIAAMFPAAQVVVHQLGARHLADPSRLMASARLVYGAAADRLFGVLAPGPATTPLATPNPTSAWSTRAAAICTSATRRGSTPPTQETCGPRRRHRTSISRSRSPHCAGSPRCSRRACCSATTDGSRRSPRRWTGRPRRSGSGWRKHARLAPPAWISIMPWPWYGTGPKTVTRRSIPTPTRPSARNSDR